MATDMAPPRSEGMNPSGYLQRQYAESLSEFGRPVNLARSGGWLLERAIHGSHDAIGCYPLFCCHDWSMLREDIADLKDQYVSVALVADPFGRHDEDLLRRTFDRVHAFKSHMVTELGPPPEQIVTRHHRYYARRALARLSVEVVADRSAFLPTWCELYANLVRRHSLTGIRAFSVAAFEQQLALDGLVALTAVHDGRVVGAHLWMTQGDVAVSHLAAVNDEGYDLSCAYALYWRALEYFTGKVSWLNLGAGAGLHAGADDGLTQFKRGWATTSRTAWFCGAVLQPEAYSALCAREGVGATDFFPAYRSRERP